MPWCCAVDCKNSTSKNKELMFHRFPSNKERQRKWAVKVGRLGEDGGLWIPSQENRLCSAHFAEDCYQIRSSAGRKMLKDDAVPTIFSHISEIPRKRKCRESTQAATVSASATVAHTSEDHGYCQQLCVNDPQVSHDPVAPSLSDIQKLEHELHEVNSLYAKQKKCNETMMANMDKLFNEDQLMALQRKGTQGMKWSEPTVKKALSLKFACGTTGYSVLLEQGMPLPSVKTLQRRMKDIHFESGVLPHVFELLRVKVDKMKDFERYCSLTLDEMSLQPKTEYDSSSGQILGGVTLPNHTGIATHGLVFMLSGICTRWKQTVAYYYSGVCSRFHFVGMVLGDLIVTTEYVRRIRSYGNSTDGAVYKDIILDLIWRAHDVWNHCGQCDQ